MTSKQVTYNRAGDDAPHICPDGHCIVQMRVQVWHRPSLRSWRLKQTHICYCEILACKNCGMPKSVISTCHWTAEPLNGPLLSHRQKLLRYNDADNIDIEMFRAQQYYINKGYGSWLKRWNKRRKNRSFLRAL